MKRIRWFYLLPLVTSFLTFSVAVFTPAASAQKMRALIIGVDEQEADSPYVENVERINSLLDQVMVAQVGDEEVCELERIRFDWTTRSNTRLTNRIERWVKDNSPDPNDVVFIYYSRQVEDPREFDQSLMLIKQMSCRLKILITDTDIRSNRETARTQRTQEVRLPGSVVRDLFLKHKGFLHLTNKTGSEDAFGDSNGGYLTQALLEAINTVGKYASRSREFGSWSEVVDRTNKLTADLFTKNIPKRTLQLMETKSQTPEVIGELPTSHPTIYALLVITNHLTDKEASDSNHDRMKGLLSGLESHGLCNLQIESLYATESMVARDQVKDWARTVSFGENDTVFIYYSGYDGRAIGQEDTQRKFVQDLEEAIKSRGARRSRLQMLIVDIYQLGPGLVIPNVGQIYPQIAAQNLFLQHKGLLHLTSKSDDELAFADQYAGGWFTDALINTLYDLSAEEDGANARANRGFLAWEELFEETRKATMEVFDSRYPAAFEQAENYPRNFSSAKRREMLDALNERSIKKSQTPQAHALPQRAD